MGLSLLAFFCLAARPAWPHHEARPGAGGAPGVGAFEAVSQARGIELRDAFNRRISRGEI